MVGSERRPFSADGTLVYVRIAGAVADIYALSPGATEPRAVVATEAVEHSPALSPDGKWLAYVEGTNPPHVYVARFPSGAARRRVTTNASNQPLWRGDGKALFYREDADRDAPGRTHELRMVTVDGGARFTSGIRRSCSLSSRHRRHSSRRLSRTKVLPSMLRPMDGAS
jgi:hypothetical protein